MFASDPGLGPRATRSAGRRTAARLGGTAIYLGPCRRWQQVLQVQLEALQDDDENDLDAFDDLDPAE